MCARADAAEVGGRRREVDDARDAVVAARVVGIEGRRRPAGSRARLGRPRDRVLVPGGEVGRGRRDNRRRVVDADRGPVGELAVDVVQVLVAAARGPGPAGVATVAAHVRLNAGAQARVGADRGTGRDVEVPAYQHCRLGEHDVVVEAQIAGHVHPGRARDVVVERLVADATGVARVEVVPNRVVERLGDSRRDGHRRLERPRHRAARLVRIPRVPNRSQIPEGTRADERAAIVDAPAPERTVQPGRGRRAARGRVRVLRPVRRALRQDVGIEGVVCRQVEDGHRVVDPRLREREGALAREALRGLGRIRRRVRGCGRAWEVILE